MNSSFLPKVSTSSPPRRDINKVPFVELFNDRLQGVISSGSDIERVYIAYYDRNSLNYNCSTNNNRPCGGVSVRPCKHLQLLLKESMAQYEPVIVGRYLGIPDDRALKPADVSRYVASHGGSLTRVPAGDIFSRFLNYLRYLELPSSNTPLPEMSWFV
jgi:hypothetical protein